MQVLLKPGILSLKKSEFVFLGTLCFFSFFATRQCLAGSIDCLAAGRGKVVVTATGALLSHSEAVRRAFSCLRVAHKVVQNEIQNALELASKNSGQAKQCVMAENVQLVELSFWQEELLSPSMSSSRQRPESQWDSVQLLVQPIDCYHSASQRLERTVTSAIFSLQVEETRTSQLSAGDNRNGFRQTFTISLEGAVDLFLKK